MLISERDGWQFEAACYAEDSVMLELFFDRFGERKADKVEREAKAMAICNGCKVIEQCLDYAIENGQDYGIWGGTNEVERRQIVAFRTR